MSPEGRGVLRWVNMLMRWGPRMPGAGEESVVSPTGTLVTCALLPVYGHGNSGAYLPPLLQP